MASAEQDAALARLCQTYWFPLYSFVRRSGHPPEDARDLTQEFFARLLEKQYLKAAAREKGRFRSFLLLVLKRFMANEWDRARCKKRGGGQPLISLDQQDSEDRYLAEPAEQLSPDKLFDRRWAVTLLHQVMCRLKAEFSATRGELLFDQLRPFLSGDEDEASYTGLSAQVGMSEGALRVMVHRLRKRYRELLRLEIANTVETPEAIDDEIRHLFSALS